MGARPLGKSQGLFLGHADSAGTPAHVAVGGFSAAPVAKTSNSKLQPGICSTLHRQAPCPPYLHALFGFLITIRREHWLRSAIETPDFSAPVTLNDHP